MADEHGAGDLFGKIDHGQSYKLARERIAPEVSTWLTAVDTINDPVPGLDISVAQASRDVREAFDDGRLLFVVSPLHGMDAYARVRTPSTGRQDTQGNRMRRTAVVLDTRADCTSYNLVSGGPGLFTIILNALREHGPHIYTADMLDSLPLGDPAIGRFPGK